jgi:hypothetical protein
VFRELVRRRSRLTNSGLIFDTLLNRTALNLSDFISEVFSLVGLDWQNHVVSDPTLCRFTDI